MKKYFFPLFFLSYLLLSIIFLTSSKFEDNLPKYLLIFNHYNPNLKSYVSYILFENKQSLANYKENVIYNFDYTSLEIIREIYNLKEIHFPAVYIPLKTDGEKKDKKAKNLGSFAQIIRKNQIMYLFDYGTPNFYKHLDYNLRGIIVALEDNIQNLVNNLYNAQKIEYKPYLDYVKSFANINKDFELTLCYNTEKEIYFEFLNIKNNKIRVISIDKYYRFQSIEKEYFQNQMFTF